MSNRLLHFYQTTKHLPRKDLTFDKTNKKFNLVTPLEVEGVTKEGYRLRIKCLCEHPDKEVSIQIEHSSREFDFKWLPLVRIDWKPDSRHINSDTREVIKGSHIHPPEKNSIGITEGRLPFAEKLPEDPENWQDLMKLAGQLLNVMELAKVQEPVWCISLL